MFHRQSTQSLIFCCSLLVTFRLLHVSHGFSASGSHKLRTIKLQNDVQGALVPLRSSSSGGSSSDDEGKSGVLFDDHSETFKVDTANSQFGESVPLKRPTSDSSDVKFGHSVPLRRPESATNGGLFAADNSAQNENSESELKKMKKRNIIAAVASVVFAVSTYLWQYTHPITPVQLLASMQSTSAPLTTIGTNGRPTVVDFWAPWCENCKASAPTLQKLEEDYKDQVNFVMVNGDRPEAWPLIERFGVDAIPHLALISAEGDVETALIGPIPKRILEADLNVLITNANTDYQSKRELPYQMMDAFSNRPDQRRVHFDDNKK